MNPQLYYILAHQHIADLSHAVARGRLGRHARPRRPPAVFDARAPSFGRPGQPAAETASGTNTP